MAFFSEFQFDLVYRPLAGKQMQVPDALSRKPRTTQDIQELLSIHNDEEGEPLMEVKIPAKTGLYRHILFALYSKSRLNRRGLDTQMLKKFQLSMYQKLTSSQPKPDPFAGIIHNQRQ
jgi:hypothetical protein